MMILPAQPTSEWRQPSQRTAVYGVENITRFRLTARLSDGYIVWRGWFDDRDDADAFLWSMATGAISQDRELWSLPSPSWSPGMGENITYDFATLVFVTSSAGSSQDITVPSDWNSASNSIEVVGGGGQGGHNGRGGGGGGAYAKLTNVSLTVGSTRKGFVGSAGAWASNNGTTATGSWLRIDSGTTTPTSTSEGVYATPGVDGGDPTAGTGGASASSVGATKYSGGNGGNSSGASNYAGGGGGGAAGPNGAGNNGSAGSGTTGGAGGSGDAGSGGAGGAASSGAGSAGTEWDASHGSGGGGGGGNSNGAVPGAGGLYGAASGGSGVYQLTRSDAKQGIIVLTYTPTIKGFGNIAMLGM